MISIRPCMRRLRMHAGLQTPRRAGHRPDEDELKLKKIRSGSTT